MTIRLLLDTHVLLSLTNATLTARWPGVFAQVSDPDVIAHASVASLWEIAIKARLGKLDPGMPLADFANACFSRDARWKGCGS